MAPALAQDIPESKKKVIEELIAEVGDMENAVVVGKEQARRNLKLAQTKRTDITDATIEAVVTSVEEVMREHSGALRTLLTLAYNKHYSEEDLHGILAFYRSPVGKKVVKAQNGLANDLLSGAGQWGRMLAPEVTRRVAERLAKDGVKL